MSSQKNSLYHAPDNSDCTVTTVPDVKLLASLGIYPGSVIRRKRKYRFGGPVLISLATRELALGKDIAATILVKEGK